MSQVTIALRAKRPGLAQGQLVEAPVNQERPIGTSGRPHTRNIKRWGHERGIGKKKKMRYGKCYLSEYVPMGMLTYGNVYLWECLPM